MPIEQGVQHGAYGTVLQDNLSFQDNLRCFGVNYDMSRITRFLCYFLSLKLASVPSYYAFPSLSGYKIRRFVSEIWPFEVGIAVRPNSTCKI